LNKLILVCLVIGLSGCMKSEDEKRLEQLDEIVRLEKVKTQAIGELCANKIKKLAKNPNDVVIIPKHSLKSLEGSSIDAVAPFRDEVIAQFHWTGKNKISINGDKYNVICEYNIENDKEVDFSVYSKKDNNFIPRYSEPDVEYFLISKEKDGEYIKTLHTRLSTQHVGYSLTRIDCKGNRYQDLGYSEKGKFDIEMYKDVTWANIISSSSKSDLYRFSCNS
jgi:hypothetical protein